MHQLILYLSRLKRMTCFVHTIIKKCFHLSNDKIWIGKRWISFNIISLQFSVILNLTHLDFLPILKCSFKWRAFFNKKIELKNVLKILPIMSRIASHFQKNLLRNSENKRLRNYSKIMRMLIYRGLIKCKHQFLHHH